MRQSKHNNITYITFQIENNENNHNGSNGNEGRRRSIQSISQLGNALSNDCVAPNTKVRVVWPKEKCKMLGEEVVIIDSPGKLYYERLRKMVY